MNVRPGPSLTIRPPKRSSYQRDDGSGEWVSSSTPRPSGSCPPVADTGSKALPIDNDPADLAATIAYEGRVDYFLFDTRCASYGGSGQAFDWSLLERYEGETPFLLSGGLRPESLDAIKAFHHPRLAGIDLNSGFESAPGIKDDQLLRTFIKQLKQQTL